MSRASNLLLRLTLASSLSLACLASAMAEPRGALVPKMDAMTQSRSPDAKPAAAPKLSPNAIAKPCGPKCGNRCTLPPARSGYFGSLFELFDGHADCTRGNIADNFDDDTLPDADRPPRLI